MSLPIPKMPIRPTAGNAEAWQDLLDATSLAILHGREFFTDTITADDYPGSPDVYAELVELDNRLRARRADAPPVSPPTPERPASKVPAHCWIDGRPRTLDDLDDHPVVDIAMTWVSEYHSLTPPSKGLLLAGPLGTGKTSIAAAVAVTCGEPNTAAFWRLTALLDQVKSEFDGDNAGWTLNRAKNKPLLVLDDLGRERQSDFNTDAVRSLLEHRYDGGLPCVITSNMLPEQLREYVGARVWSRLAEMVDVVLVEGPDRRLAGVQ